MRIGVDSYSYHRLLREVRQGERPSPAPPFATGQEGAHDVLAAVAASGAELASLETVFLPPPERLDAGALLAAAGGLELALAWGHPDGLAWGADAAALEELCVWIARAPRLGVRLVRLVAASPRLRDAGTRSPGEPGPGDSAGLGASAEQLDGTARAVRRALRVADAAGVALAIENHGDLTAAALAALLDCCDGLGVCFDTANALRVGDDPVAAAALLAPAVRMVHLKDCEAGGGADPVTGPCSVPYGTGVVDVEAVLAALRPVLAGGVGVDRVPVCVELAQLGHAAGDERLLVADGVAWLRRWRAAAGLAT